MSGKPLVIGITGGSGAGKSYVLKLLRDAFEPGEVSFFSQDNYYRRREEQVKDRDGMRNFDLPESFDMDEFVSDLKQLVAGDSVTRTEYVYNNENLVSSEIRIDPAPVVIAEGLFLMHLPEIREQLDLSVYVSVSDILKLKRRIIRDQECRNYPLEDVLYRYEYHVLPAYLQFIKPYKSQANIVINNNDQVDAAVAVLTGYIRNHLGTLKLDHSV